MVKINYPDNFKVEKYIDIFNRISIKDNRLQKAVNKNEEELKELFELKENFITGEELFNKWKELILKDEDIDLYNKFKDILFKDLTIGNFKKLRDTKNKVGKIENNKFINFLFDYRHWKRNIIKFFENNLTMSVCYYCNLEFINSKKNKKDFTLDHFYSQKDYPYLSISLYNFIPSCSICNSDYKKDKEINSLSPTCRDFDFDKKVKFKLFLSKDCKDFNIKSKDDIEIELKEKYSNRYQNYIDTFNLKERYKNYPIHKDIVFEMIENAQLYPESRLKELEKLTGVPYQQIKRDIFKLIDNEVDLSKEPFSKLKRDIAYELGLL